MDTHDTATARAWVEVDLGSLLANYDSIAARAKPRVGMLPVVKADAYGLGACPVVRALERRNPWGYAVAALAEGVELRERGIDRRIVLLFSTPAELEGAAEARLTPVIGDAVALERWNRLARASGERLPFHLEIDTGMGRCGFRHDTVDAWLPAALDAAGASLEWEGTLTHFHSADDEREEPSREQWARFRACMDRFPGGVGGVVHTTASVAGLRWPEMAADLVRPGIHLYGGVAGAEPVEPRTVATVHARVTAVRDVPEGWTASYGATYRASRPSRWATLSIGYADGVRRELSNQGFVSFGDRTAPIIGRVCMDVVVVDVSDHTEIEAGSVATVIGGPVHGPTGLATVAARCGTISYEILTGLTKRLPRTYTGL